MNPLLSRETATALVRVLHDARRGEVFEGLVIASGDRILLVAHRDLRRGETVSA